MRKIFLAILALLGAAVFATGGYLVRAAQDDQAVASVSELEQGLAVALDLSPAEVHNHAGYAVERTTGCASGTCLHVRLGPVPGPGTDMQRRLYDAGWLLQSQYQPECVSDSPAVTGFVCSYQRGAVIVSVQVESPDTPNQLAIWASTG